MIGNRRELRDYRHVFLHRRVLGRPSHGRSIWLEILRYIMVHLRLDRSSRLLLVYLYHG